MIERDYRKFRLSKLKTPEFSHLLLLLFWPIYGIMFFLLERILPLTFHRVYVHFDDLIPFCEFFIIPYYMWFVFLVGMVLYLGLCDIENFRKYMYFIIISYSVTVVIYLVYPTYQDLRPTIFERDNIFVHIVQFLYGFDTNTNVCPSIHVLGMAGAFMGGWRAKGMQKIGWKIFWVISLILVCISTVFLKQHSIIDVIAGAALSFVTYLIVYRTKIFEKKREKA